MIQNIYTNFILSKQTNKNKQKQKPKQKNNKRKALLFVQLSICSNIFVMLPQRRPYTTYTITVVKIGNISVVINVTKTK
jgi:hypothetical protein